MQLAGDTLAFAFMILSVAKDALLVRSLQTLENFLQVRLVIGSPARAGPSDPDEVGLLDWQVAIYSTGINTGLAFIEFIINYKVRKGLLASAPRLLVHAADPGGVPLPHPWQKLQDNTIAIPKLFNAMPPKGRRHVLAQLEQQPEQGLETHATGNKEAGSEADEAGDDDDVGQGRTYLLAFYGNLYPFKDRFEQYGIPGTFTVINNSERPDFVRFVRFKYEATAMQKVIFVLEKVLKKMPVYFINMAGDADMMAQWVRQQPSIIPAESVAPAQA